MSIDLYVVAERSIFDSDAAWLDAIAAVCDGHVPGLALQVRLKDEPADRREALAAEARIATWDATIPVFLNGETDEAAGLGYDGVHWPEALIAAERTAVSDLQVGASVHSSAAALRAEEVHADFVVAGTIFDAGSKDAPGAGLGHLRAIAEATSLPVLAIGGVTAERVASCVEAGAYGVAVVTAVLRAPDIASAIRDLREALDVARAKAKVG